MRRVKKTCFGLMAALAWTSACAALPAVKTQQSAPEESSAAAQQSYLSRLPQDEIIYFVLPDRFENGDTANDRGGLSGGPLDHGFDPTSKGFFNGGDLKGLTSRLDYIEGLGATAIWLGPIYQNKAVQGPKGLESAGYHGYWITDFTSVDAHIGDEADMKDFVDGAHARGMKVYLDIITNHTADVIKFRECADPNWTGEKVAAGTCPYRSLANYPYTTKGNVNGEAINQGFMGDRPPFQTAENFKKLERSDYAYTPFIPEGEEAVKTPAWLNDMRYYHNRGDTTFRGEDSLYGDFVGLDDLMTEDPFVVQGFIDIYGDWIEKYRIDGFRIDTAKHVNAEFWRAFNAAMLERAERIGIPNFTIFGEAAYERNPAGLAKTTTVDEFPTTLDFGIQEIITDVLVDEKPTSVFDDLFMVDLLWREGSVLMAPTFIGNHDRGRFAGFLKAKHPGMSDEEMFKRVRLAHAAMFFMRGVPVIYYGDEQGFVSDGNDQLARESMFPSRVAVYNDNDLIATDATTAESNFDVNHPLYQAVRTMSDLYNKHSVLRRGEQIVRLTELDGGAMAFSRIDPRGQEAVVIMNFRNESRMLNTEVDPRSTSFTSLQGACPSSVSATGVARVSLGPLDYAVCLSNTWVDSN